MCDADTSCCNVSIGPQGTNGYQGESNTRGPQGDVGFQSDIVIVGSQGMQGLMGLGDLGVPGITGLQGPSAQGAQGSQGPPGFLSSNGPQGFEGNRGSQGVDGISQTGSQGQQGLPNSGNQGERGFQGWQGLSNQGPQGPVGSILQPLSTASYNSTIALVPSNIAPTALVPSTVVGPGTYVVIFDGTVSCTSPPNVTLALPGASANQIIAPSANHLPVHLQSRITTVAVSTNIGPTIVVTGGIPSSVNVTYLVQIIAIA